jgi:hypothetical protein
MARRGVAGGTWAGIITPPAGSDDHWACARGGRAPAAVDGALAVPAAAPGIPGRDAGGSVDRTVPGGRAAPAGITVARGGAADVCGAGILGGRA